MAHPTIIGMAYDPANTNGRFITYEPTFIESHRSIAICLACLEKRLPRQMRSMLQRIYKAYEIEMALAQQTNNERGRWLRHDYEPEFTWEMLAKERKSIPPVCIFTGRELEKDRPFFTLRMIDRVNSTIGMGIPTVGEGNYQVTGRIERSGTEILVSFDAFREQFGMQFRELGCQLRGVKNTEAPRRGNELIIDPSFKETLEKETGKSMDQIIKESFVGKGKGNIAVIYRDNPAKSKTRC
jgi:hypothetical protein